MEIMDFIQSFLGDEFLSKAFILGLVTGALVYMRRFPNQVWNRVKRKIIFTTTIEQTDILFDYLERWLKDNHSKKYRDVLANVDYRNFAMNNYPSTEVPDSSDNSDNKKKEVEKVEYRHNRDIIFIRREGSIIRIQKGRDKLENAKSLTSLFFDSYSISIFFFKKNVQRLLAEVVEYNQQFKPDEDVVNIYGFDGYSAWNKIKILNPKRVDNIILKKGIKTQILNDITLFTKQKNWYNKRFIPYKRGYLFHGSPGNGKTSMALALACYLEKDIYTLPISEVNDDGDLKRLFRNISNNAILLIEDIDAVFNNRKSKSKVSFSSLLNCLDGIYYKDGIITIMTTNHVEKLDSALIRDGRVDLKVEFKNPESEQVREYVELFYGISLNGQNYDKDFSMAKIQNYCIKNTKKEIVDILFE